jgi:general secretion pathway protein A
VYTAFYGLKEEPFNITPDPRFLYWSPKHQEAFRHLVYGVQSNKGLVVLTGAPGTGKTAILHAVTEHLNKVYPGVHIAFLVNSKITVQDMFCLIFDEFQIENTVDSKSMYLIHLKNFLRNNHLKNEKNVLILDEAQNFHPTILEEIRLLSNMETAAEKLLHIFLVGQPQLIDNIKTPSLGQLKQRLGIIYNLLPLNRQETEFYIQKRLSVAGAQAVDLFTSAALDEIFAHAKGLPRLINTICDNALLFGCAANEYEITPEIIRRVAQDMDIARLEEDVATDSGLATEPPSRSVEPPTLTSAGVPPTLQSSGRHEPQDPASDDADRFIILQNTVLSEESYWDNLLGKNASSDRNLAHIWQQRVKSSSAWCVSS